MLIIDCDCRFMLLGINVATVYLILLIIGFALIGFGLKYLDIAFDEKRFSKRGAMLMAPFLVAIMTGLSLYDPISATILLSISYSYAFLITGKVNNLQLKLSSITLVVIITIFLFTQMSRLLTILFIVLAVMCVLDKRRETIL
ncbi:MAG TPA: hypothetical protein VMW67_04705 [Desulfobacteria bacterium]|nr:hypothetical protein [Desulfobacteria bacterium]